MPRFGISGTTEPIYIATTAIVNSKTVQRDSVRIELLIAVAGGRLIGAIPLCNRGVAANHKGAAATLHGIERPGIAKRSGGVERGQQAGSAEAHQARGRAQVA
jgi:hypothetical protein